MKTLAACVLILATLLAGCAGTDQPSVSTPTEDYGLPEDELREIDEEVMVEGKNGYDGGSDVSDAEFVAFGRDVCGRFDSGQEFGSVHAFAIREWEDRFGRRLGFVEAAELVGDSVGSLCEGHTVKLD